MKARRGVMGVLSDPLLNSRSQKSMNTPPTMSITATRVTLPRFDSMKSLKANPSTTAGIMPTMSSP